jgi:hypothetical protein
MNIKTLKLIDGLLEENEAAALKKMHEGSG